MRSALFSAFPDMRQQRHFLQKFKEWRSNKNFAAHHRNAWDYNIQPYSLFPSEGEILLEPEIDILVDLGDGGACATAWGCDLTYDYVKINGDYRT